LLLASPLSAQVTNTNTVTNGGTIGSGITSLITNPVTTITGAIAILTNSQLSFVRTSSTITDAYAISGSRSLTMAGSGMTIVPVPEPGVLLAGLLLLGWVIFSFRNHIDKESRALLIALTFLAVAASMKAAPKPTATPKPTPTPISTPVVVATRTPAPAPSATPVPTPPPAQLTPNSP
jgi:hypothetical protein